MAQERECRLIRQTHQEHHAHRRRYLQARRVERLGRCQAQPRRVLAAAKIYETPDKEETPKEEKKTSKKNAK